MVHGTSGPQTEADEPTEPGNKQATTSIAQQRKGAVGLQRRTFVYWKFVLLHAKTNNVNFDSFIDVILQYSQSKQPEYVKSVIEKLSQTCIREKQYFPILRFPPNQLKQKTCCSLSLRI